MLEQIPFYDLGALIEMHRAELRTAFDTVLDSGIFIGGPEVENFEVEFAEFLGVEFFRGTGNGLDAIRIGLEALGVGPGDEVLVPAFSFFATWLAVLQVGATPVLVDVELFSGNMSLTSLKSMFSARVKAIIVVHLFGNPAPILEIVQFAKDNNLFVLEDCAQSHGATVANRKVGTFGDFGAFSFYPTKNLGALGDAGGLATSKKRLADSVVSKRSYGQGRTKYEHVDLGWNSRLDPVQASFLRVLLSNLDVWNERRREIANYYLDHLGGRNDLVLGSSSIERGVWHHFVMRVDNRDTFRKSLAQQGINTDIHYPYSANSVAPLQQKVRAVNQLSHSNSDLLARTVVSLPIGPWMTDVQVERVATGIKSLEGTFGS